MRKTYRFMDFNVQIYIFVVILYFDFSFLNLVRINSMVINQPIMGILKPCDSFKAEEDICATFTPVQ